MISWNDTNLLLVLLLLLLLLEKMGIQRSNASALYRLQESL
jgi:hypothetical protein